MCDVDLTARLVSSHLSFLHTNLNWNSGGVRKDVQLPSEQLTQKKKNVNGDFSFIIVHGNLWIYLWHLFHLSADTTLCVRCLAKGWFSTGSHNTSLLQYQYQLVFTLQQSQNKLFNGRKQRCGHTTWARSCFHRLPRAALLVLRRLDGIRPGSRLAPHCLEAPAIDAGELAGAPLWPLRQVAVTCTLKE